MKPVTLATAVLGLLWPVAGAGAGADDNSPQPSAASSTVILPSNFRPPPVFKNTNLVHLIALDKNYAKEAINVVVENVSREPQDEYYVPFTADRMQRLGGFEAKDKKNAEAGPFGAEAVEFDPYSDVQYYRIKLPTPLQPASQQTLAISFYYLKAYRPLPASINQDGEQFIVYEFSAYCPSAYATSKQKTEVRCGSSNIPDYTTMPGTGGGEAPNPQVQGSTLTYGPFGEKAAGAVYAASVRYEFTKPLTHVAVLDRDVEVSHWGGNVAFEERYELHNRGANLSTLFNRVKWAQGQYHKPATYALKELRFSLKPGSVDAYYTDVIGNVSTSRFRAARKESVLETRPRYPVFGGWKYPFTIGWNSNAANYVRSKSDGAFVVNVPFMEGPKQAEGVEYGKVNFRLILPEGAENIKLHATLPPASVVETSVGIHKSFLDTIGRTTVTIKAQNLVDDFRDRSVLVSYDVPLAASLRKPLLIFASTLGGFVLWAVMSRLEVKITSTSKKKTN